MAEHIVLHVEDSLDDRYLFQRAAEVAGVNFAVYAVEHGQEAVDYLAGTGKYTRREQFPLPGLLLLDLKMPVMDGFELLEWLRKHRLKDLPAVVFTSSYQHVDVKRGYEEGAIAFVTKPGMLDELVCIARALDRCFTAKGVNCSALETLPQFKRA
ncbi:MAG TPA: response regulator [Verrucomicrobiae bacterium]|nr:response regulator [Verrucomicrobiae bacterium]